MRQRCTHKQMGAFLVNVRVMLLLCSLAAPGFAGGVEHEVLALINAQRVQAGCGPLALDARLSAAAQGHADAMARQDFFAHTGKNGSKFFQRIKAQGYSYHAASENIAAGQKSASAVVKSWMASRTHRHNILNCRMTETGIGMAYQPDDKPLAGRSSALRYYWVQDFGRP